MTFLNDCLDGGIDEFIFWLNDGMFSDWLYEFSEWVNDWLAGVLTPSVNQKSHSFIQSVSQPFIKASETVSQSIIEKSHSVIQLVINAVSHPSPSSHSVIQPISQSEKASIYHLFSQSFIQKRQLFIQSANNNQSFSQSAGHQYSQSSSNFISTITPTNRSYNIHKTYATANIQPLRTIKSLSLVRKM